MRQANASLAFIVLVRFYEATDQLRARSPWSDAQSIPSTPKEHGTSCLSSQGTNQMIIQATQSSNWRHSEEQGESRFATPHGSSSRKGAKQPKPMGNLIDRQACSHIKQEQGEFRFATPRMPLSLRSNYPLRESSERHADYLIDRPDCSKLVGTFNLFIPCCRHGASTKGRFQTALLVL